MDPTVWGPSYWFFLHNVAFHYPNYPTTIQKKIYYRLIHNFHEFLPNKSIGNLFSKLINKYPVTPYLDNRDSFVRWIIFIHNRVNVQIGKKEITIDEAMDKYFQQMVPPTIFKVNTWEYRKYIIYTLVIILLAVAVYFLYNF